MVPAACLAAIAAFSSGLTASLLTVIAAVLTVGAVLLTNELLSAARLLEGAAFVAVGVAGIAGGPGALAQHFALMGIASIVFGAAFAAYGVAAIAGHAALIEITKNAYAIAAVPLVIAVSIEPQAHIGPTFSHGAATPAMIAAFFASAASVVLLAARFGRWVRLAVGAIITFGVAVIAVGAVTLADGSALIGAAGITLGTAVVVFTAAMIGPRTIVSRLRQIADWATQVPQGAGPQDANSEIGEN